MGLTDRAHFTEVLVIMTYPGTTPAEVPVIMTAVNTITRSFTDLRRDNIYRTEERSLTYE